LNFDAGSANLGLYTSLTSTPPPSVLLLVKVMHASMSVHDRIGDWRLTVAVGLGA
jgi:hypothetical protein